MCDLGVDPLDDIKPYSHATHQLTGIKSGDFSVQLLISTKDQLYDAQNVETGCNSWQVIGGWEESSLGELTSLLSTRPAMASQNTKGTTSFGTRYGGGQKLGTL